MSYQLTLRKEAELDVEEQFHHYERKREGLGYDFILCLEDAFAKLKRNPLIYRKVYKELRRIPVGRFPYRMFFLVQDRKVIVTAVFHVRKDPQSWSVRS